MNASGINRKPRRKSEITASADIASIADAGDPSEHIAVAAYYKAQARGFAPGQEIEDWLEAEQELRARNAGR